ncbi:MAG: peptidylprolyl isomerase [Anaerolineales bacterium]
MPDPSTLPPPSTPGTNAAPPTVALATPTLTPEPLTALVNGEAITLAAYQKEVERCRAAHSDAVDCPAVVLQSLVEQKVVEQAATAAGVNVPAEDVEAAWTQIIADLGGTEAYTAWLAANFYTEDGFREALRRDLLRARIGEQAVAQIGDAAEQVHALQLLVDDEATAQDLLSQIKGGADFAPLAVQYSLDLSSRAAGGDLGWFPRGLLTMPEVEQAAFALQPGEISDVIHSALGYHLVKVIERDPVHPLSPSAEQALRARAYQAWLEGLLAAANVETYITP